MLSFARRLDSHSITKRQLESLVAAGAFDSINSNRAQTFASIPILLRYAAKTQEENIELDNEFNIELTEINELNSGWFDNYFCEDN